MIIDNSINNTVIYNNIRLIHRDSHRWQRDRYYWYEHGSTRYCHYYDTRGYHWFGFYYGSDYYWARYHNDRFWWYDPVRYRWVYYWNNYWWWHDTSNVVYVYIDNSYYQYNESRGGVVVRPEPPAGGGGSTPAPAPEETVFYSEDGSRMVQVFGERKEAFLYDITKEEPEFLAFLAEDAAEVQFSTDENAPLSILIVVEKKTTKPDGTVDVDRSFKLFDANGQTTGSTSSSAPSLQGSSSFGELQQPNW